MHHQDTVKSGRHNIIIIETQCRSRDTATHAVVGHEANEHTRVSCRAYGHTAIAAACYKVLLRPPCKDRIGWDTIGWER